MQDNTKIITFKPTVCYGACGKEATDMSQIQNNSQEETTLLPDCIHTSFLSLEHLAPVELCLAS